MTTLTIPAARVATIMAQLRPFVTARDKTVQMSNGSLLVEANKKALASVFVGEEFKDVSMQLPLKAIEFAAKKGVDVEISKSDEKSWLSGMWCFRIGAESIWTPPTNTNIVPPTTPETHPLFTCPAQELVKAAKKIRWLADTEGTANDVWKGNVQIVLRGEELYIASTNGHMILWQHLPGRVDAMFDNPEPLNMASSVLKMLEKYEDTADVQFYRAPAKWDEEVVMSVPATGLVIHADSSLRYPYPDWQSVVYGGKFNFEEFVPFQLDAQKLVSFKKQKLKEPTVEFECKEGKLQGTVVVFENVSKMSDHARDELKSIGINTANDIRREVETFECGTADFTGKIRLSLDYLIDYATKVSGVSTVNCRMKEDSELSRTPVLLEGGDSSPNCVIAAYA